MLYIYNIYVYKLLLHISWSTWGWQWRCLIRGFALTWPRRRNTFRTWRGECPVFRNGWLLWMRQVKTWFQSFSECKCSSCWNIDMKALNCVLPNIDIIELVWIEFLSLFVWWSLIPKSPQILKSFITLLGIWGDETLQTFTFSIQLPLAGKIWQCVTSLNADQGPHHFQERLLTKNSCTSWDLTWHDTTLQSTLDPWHFDHDFAHESSEPDFGSILILNQVKKERIIKIYAWEPNDINSLVARPAALPCKM